MSQSQKEYYIKRKWRRTKSKKDARETDTGKRKAGKNLREKEKEEINKEIYPCCIKYLVTSVECGQCGNWFHYKCENTTEYICKKDQLTKFANAENINNPNQDNTVVELKEKLRSSEIIQKGMEATLTKLKRANKTAKKSLAEQQAKNS